MTINLPAGEPISPGCLHAHFSTQAQTRPQQLLAWRSRLDHLLDVPVSRAQLANGFRGTIDLYQAADLRLTDSHTDPVSQTRSPARISTDAVRDHVFHIVLEGCVETTTGLHPKRTSRQSEPGILALDLNQPMRMERTACRVLALFVPRALLHSVMPEPESMHGKVIEYRSPRARLISSTLANLRRDLPRMGAGEAREAMRVCALLIAAAFGREAGLTGTARMAARAAVFSAIRRHIAANLHETDLSPDSVQQASQLSRATLYRLFENEGGLATYIRNCRLREAADQLRQSPHKAVVDIAFELGFGSASDFNHAFRRAYDMAPRDFRWFAPPPDRPAGAGEAQAE
ncbi:AraC family transcriptional regulator [Burkholderia perseverans]|uniref:AraC family transcriptional regulator n=1 Tax=Burkholderia perseverans TaxID=2615214 RepID=UPI001FEF014F|nr:AraC family transcriptional regulator [Burkholderia perseverans]